MGKELLIKFWKSFIYLDEINHFLKDSSTLWDRAFFWNLAHISGKTRKIYHGRIFGRGCPR